MTVAADDIRGPNGLAFSPDESKLYVVESRAQPKRAIRRFDVANDGMTLRNGVDFGEVGDGTPDGFRCDVDGNLWCGAAPGVQILAPSGELIGIIRLPENCANVCFGGTKRNRLFMAASQSLYVVYVNTTGAHIA